MSTAISAIETILNAAAERAAAKGLPYAGELMPQEAYEVLQQGEFTLVDVRSLAELELVGRVPTANHVEWAFYPGMLPNAHFAAQLQVQVDKNQSVVFMCRTGGRSHSAAVVAQQLGYEAYNMLEGFEGAANEQRQRSLMNGWKHANLPWSN